MSKEHNKVIDTRLYPVVDAQRNAWDKSMEERHVFMKTLCAVIGVSLGIFFPLFSSVEQNLNDCEFLLLRASLLFMILTLLLGVISLANRHLQYKSHGDELGKRASSWSDMSEVEKTQLLTNYQLIREGRTSYWFYIACLSAFVLSMISAMIFVLVR